MAQISSTQQPKSQVELQKKKLGGNWTALSQALYTTYDAALSDREILDRNLTIWNNFYEKRVGKRNWPWPNASNVMPPIIPTQLDTMLANIVLAVYAIQQFYVVNGNPEAAAEARSPMSSSTTPRRYSATAPPARGSRSTWSHLRRPARWCRRHGDSLTKKSGRRFA